MGKPVILTGKAHPELAEIIAKVSKSKFIPCEYTTFPNTELKVKINSNIRGADVFIVQPTCRSDGRSVNDNIMELMLLNDAARRASAGSITNVIPLFGYARQDRKDEPRVPISAKLVAQMLSHVGVSRIVAMDLHAAQIQGFFEVPVDHLYGWRVLSEAIKAESHSDLVVASPDAGAIKLAESFADHLDVNDIVVVTKKRKSATEVQPGIVINEQAIRDRTILITDDMTETAGTLVNAANMILPHKPRRIIAAVSHMQLGPKGYLKLQESPIEKIFVTNSVPQPSHSKVQVCCIGKMVGEAVRRIHTGESVTSLFS